MVLLLKGDERLPGAPRIGAVAACLNRHFPLSLYMTYRGDHPVEEPELCDGNEGGEAPGDLVECLA